MRDEMRWMKKRRREEEARVGGGNGKRSEEFGTWPNWAIEVTDLELHLIPATITTTTTTSSSVFSTTIILTRLFYCSHLLFLTFFVPLIQIFLLFRRRLLSEHPRAVDRSPMNPTRSTVFPTSSAVH